MELTYARWLSLCTRVALVVLAASFAAYVTGALDPLIGFERLPELWRLPLDAFLAASGAPQGWAWLGALGKGDYANLAGVALLASVTLLCYLRLGVALLRRGERLALALVALQILVLVAAASGLLSGAR